MGLPQKGPTHLRTHICATKEPYTSAKEPCISTGEPCISTAAPCVAAKEPNMWGSKRGAQIRGAATLLQKNPIKETILQKRSLFFKYVELFCVAAKEPHLFAYSYSATNMTCKQSRTRESQVHV